jgi:hypothetical protein
VFKLDNEQVYFSSVCGNIRVLDINETVVRGTGLFRAGVSHEIHRTKRIKQSNLPVTGTVDRDLFQFSTRHWICNRDSQLIRQAGAIGKLHNNIVSRANQFFRNFISVTCNGESCRSCSGVPKNNLAGTFFADTFNVLLSSEIHACSIFSFDIAIHFKEDVTHRFNLKAIDFVRRAHSRARRLGLNCGGCGVFSRNAQV